MDLSHILNDINFDNYKTINVIEIGTGLGENSTVNLYNYFTQLNKKFILNSYEGEPGNFKSANKYWKNKDDVVEIINEYVSNKDDIKTLLIPNIPSYIKDYMETNERFIKKYKKVYDLETNNYIEHFKINPDIVFIDCSRFMHLPIINKCYELTKNNDKSCIYIIEDDYFVDEIYGELEIIEKHFKLKNIKKYQKQNWQWPFVSFEIDYKY